MPSFYPRHGDTLLWICLATAGTVLAFNARKHLLAIREATRVTKEEKHDEIISQRTEDAVKLETLGELLQSPSYELRQAATKIIVERSVRRDNFSLLLENIHSKSPQRRDQGLHSLRFLITTSKKLVCAPADIDVGTRTLDVVIEFLVSRLPDVRKREHAPTDWRTRPQSERDALVILATSMQFHLAPALSAGLVSRWLAQYPFGGPNAPSQEKQNLLNRVAVGVTDDVLLHDVLRLLVYDPVGRRALRQAMLVKGSFEEDVERGWDRWGFNTSASAGVRLREESPEEVALRRRRRMAMVINEGGPLGRDNIFDGAGWAA